MKNIIRTLLVVILTSIIALIVVFVFNPFDLRTKLVGSLINSYLSSTIENYEPAQDGSSVSESAATDDKHPLLSGEQEKMLESYGVDISKLPATVSPEMEACFVEKLGAERAKEIVGGSSPTSLEVFKARSCLGE